MQINIHTDSTIANTAGLNEHVQSVLEAALNRFRDNLTRIEVHISDTNGPKGGADKLKRAIDSALGRLQDSKRHATGKNAVIDTAEAEETAE